MDSGIVPGRLRDAKCQYCQNLPFDLNCSDRQEYNPLGLFLLKDFLTVRGFNA